MPLRGVMVDKSKSMSGRWDEGDFPSSVDQNCWYGGTLAGKFHRLGRASTMSKAIRRMVEPNRAWRV